MTPHSSRFLRRLIGATILIIFGVPLGVISYAAEVISDFSGAIFEIVADFANYIAWGKP